MRGSIFARRAAGGPARAGGSIASVGLAIALSGAILPALLAVDAVAPSGPAPSPRSLSKSADCAPTDCAPADRVPADRAPEDRASAVQNSTSQVLTAPLPGTQDPPRGEGGDETPDTEAEKARAEEERLTDHIRRNLASLTHGKAKYDGRTLTVVYEDPGAVQADAELFGKGKPENIEYREPHIRVKGEDGICCFAGHSQAGILLAPRFRGTVRFEADLQYQWVERGSHLLMLAHASSDGFWGSDFGARPLEKAGARKRIRFRRSKYAAYNGEASKWVDRTARHIQILEQNDEGKRTTRLDAEVTGELDGETDAGGRVGFLWDGVKFVVVRMEVRGTLDRAWAAEVTGYEPRE